MTPVFIKNFRATYTCSTCSAEAQSERKMCPQHLAACRQTWYRHVAARMAVGQCIGCHRKAVPGEQRCTLHKRLNAKRAMAWYRENREYRLKYDRERKAEWIARGLCPVCAEHREVRPGYRRCSTCQFNHHGR